MLTILLTLKILYFVIIIMNFYLQILFIILIASICSLIIPSAFSIENKDNNSFFQQQRCNDDSCSLTTCLNDQPCKTTIGSNNETSIDTGDELLALFT